MKREGKIDDAKPWPPEGFGCLPQARPALARHAEFAW